MFAVSAAALVLGLSISGAPADRPDAEAAITIKIDLRSRETAWLLQEAQVAPAGLTDMLFVLGTTSLIAKGSALAVEELRSAVTVVDVPPVHGNQLTLRLRRANPATLRVLALTLPKAGTVLLDGKTLSLQGDPSWLQSVRALAYVAEMGEPALLHDPKWRVDPSQRPDSLGK